MKYEILPHTGDLKIRAYGKTKEELFLAMLFGMEKYLRAEIKKKKKIKREIKIKAIDFPTLLVDFLNKVLYLNQVNKEIYDDVKFRKFSDFELEGELVGRKLERFGEDIKAVTYHNLEVKKREDKTWEATVLFDV